jgi:hypothetical protein
MAKGPFKSWKKWGVEVPSHSLVKNRVKKTWKKYALESLFILIHKKSHREKNEWKIHKSSGPKSWLAAKTFKKGPQNFQVL